MTKILFFLMLGSTNCFGQLYFVATANMYVKSEVLFVKEHLVQNKNQFIIYQDNSNKHLKASNPNNVAIRSFKLYDILGKVVLAKYNLGSESNFSFSTNGLSYGIYIVEFLTTDNEKLTQKVVISNSTR